MLTFAALLRPRRFVAAVAAATALPACIVITEGDRGDDDGRECTLVGCADGLEVELASRSGAWAPGSYRFVLVADGKTITCDATLPLPPCGQAPSARCDAPEVTVGESGCALPAERHGFSSLSWTTSPASVDVTIARDGVPVADAFVAPTYVESQPNGPDCGPSCRNASARVDAP